MYLWASFSDGIGLRHVTSVCLVFECVCDPVWFLALGWTDFSLGQILDWFH